MDWMSQDRSAASRSRPRHNAMCVTTRSTYRHARHVDFTVEVERSLRCSTGRGSVDRRRGRRAQSETVWRQADGTACRGSAS